jgi:hypothetical protein
MKIDLFNTEEFIELNKLKEVTSPVLFQRGDIPHPDGLISNQIFGVTVQSRKSTFAYVDLHGYFFHPHVYKAIKRMFRNIETIISGQQFYSINENGILVLDKNGQTGIDFIYENWEKINWEKSDSAGMRNERVDLLNNFKKEEIFTRYLIIIPPFYRDIKSSSSGGETGELNKLYSNAIRYASLLKEKDMFDFQFNQTNLNMQELLVSIYDYFKTKLEKKTGMLRRYLLGKNVDYCTRSVITAPNYHASTPDDLFVDFRHAAIPISQVCSLCNPYIMKWVKDFFDRELFSIKESAMVYDPIQDRAVQVRLDKPESIFTDKWLKKMVDTYIRDPESRFNTIEIPVINGKRKYYMAFTGRRFDTTNKSEISELAYRPLTWTDILYQACVDVTKDKHCLVTRYPLLDEFGIFIARIRVASTTKTTPIYIGGTLYKWYPVIELDTDKERMATKFVDSLQFSNAYLPGLDRSHHIAVET